MFSKNNILAESTIWIIKTNTIYLQKQSLGDMIHVKMIFRFYIGKKKEHWLELWQDNTTYIIPTIVFHRYFNVEYRVTFALLWWHLNFCYQDTPFDGNSSCIGSEQ